MVVWWATPVEIASALARLLRMKQISSAENVQSQMLAQKLADMWSVIQPSDVLQSSAVQLLTRYELQASDSLQLAAALAWCQNVPLGRVFLSADSRLRQAASACGFDAQQI